MSIFERNQYSNQRNRFLVRVKKLSFGAVLSLLLFGIASTLASNISLNNSENLEFGQGVAMTSACDDSIIVTPISTFDYASSEKFRMTEIRISKLNLTPAGCLNKYIMIRAFTENMIYNSETRDGNIASPLNLTRPIGGGSCTRGHNSGIGFRIGNVSSLIADNTSYDGCPNSANFEDLDISWNFTTDPENAQVTIFLGETSDFNAPESAWVDILTIESLDALPDSWNSSTT